MANQKKNNQSQSDEFFNFMHEVVSNRLEAAGLSAKLSADIACEVEQKITNHFGGTLIYFKAKTIEKAEARQVEIIEAAENGESVFSIACRLKLSQAAVYCVLRKHREAAND